MEIIIKFCNILSINYFLFVTNLKTNLIYDQLCCLYCD